MFRTAMLLALMTAILIAIGFLLAGIAGMALFFLFALAINFVSYWYSDKIVLGMYKAKLLESGKIHSIVEKLAKEAGLPTPRLYVVEMDVPNAFATGRNPKHSAIAVTRGLVKNLNDDEIEGVLAHEMSHIKDRDTLTSTVATTIAGAIAFIAQLGWYMSSDNRRDNGILIFLVILAPIAAMFIQLAISRSREYLADETGARISKKPLSLASALEKISSVAKSHPIRGNAATSQLFIVNPFSSSSLMSLFSTHPPIAERVRRLREMKL